MLQKHFVESKLILDVLQDLALQYMPELPHQQLEVLRPAHDAHLENVVSLCFIHTSQVLAGSHRQAI